MKSGLYTFCDGHIYFNKNVIKIRYDLINSENTKNYTENDIFDFYSDIFESGDGFKVDSGTPIDSYRGHRFGYFISDLNKL